ncbi:MAG: hypothetical protein M1371_09645 [Actinobacteria bacterium]|nr:hypothetical protein [Actinomycetota bacterium]
MKTKYGSGKPRVGVVTLTDERKDLYTLEREILFRDLHKKLVEFLKKQDFEVIDPMSALRPTFKDWFGVVGQSDVNFVADYLKANKAECCVVQSHFWISPMLAVDLVKQINVPVMLYKTKDDSLPGTVSISAIGASLLEAAPNRHALTHERMMGDFGSVAVWARGVCTSEKMKKSSIILWGGSYAQQMVHLEDDNARLKQFIISEILNEGHTILIKKMEKIRKEEPERIEGFYKWLLDNRTNIVFDEKMLTEEILRIQIGLYLAARDRISELEEYEISGAGVKCHYELSGEMGLGVEGCLIPAFLSYGEDAEGKKDVIPVGCEGDIKGVLTQMLFQKATNRKTSAIQGDIKYIGDDYFMLSNCGSSTIYWASFSMDPRKTLPEVTICGNCHGFGGGAVGFCGKEGSVTIGRLVRINGQYYMHLGKGRSLEVTGKLKERVFSTYIGSQWPQVAVSMGVKAQKLIRTMGSNHPCAIDGDYIEEIKYTCRELGVPIVRIDSDESLDYYYENVLGAPVERGWK